MTKLGVNIDHIATIRQARRAVEPDPTAAAVLAELAGADGITVHLRKDRRHIQDRDVELLRRIIKTRLNVEMSVDKEMQEFACHVKPDTVTLVPERDDEITTEGGLNVVSYEEAVTRTVRRLQNEEIQVSLFIDPKQDQIDASLNTGARLIELNTAAYSDAVPLGLNEGDEAFLSELEALTKSSNYAARKGLRVLAGHGLTYRNVGPVSAISEIEELNIGHNIIARSSLVGLDQAVREMLQAMNP